MTKYLIKFVQMGESSEVNITCKDETMAVIFFEMAFPDAIILSIEKSLVQIITTKPCLN